MNRITYFNRHLRDLDSNYSFEYDVKGISFGIDISGIMETCNCSENDVIRILDFDLETGEYTNFYAKQCFNEIQEKIKYINLSDWSFAGRMNGWFCLLSENDYSECDNEEYLDDIYLIESIVGKYCDSYCNYMTDHIIDEIQMRQRNKKLNEKEEIEKNVSRDVIKELIKWLNFKIENNPNNKEYLNVLIKIDELKTNIKKDIW